MKIQCKWYIDEFCTNENCPCLADFCPVQQDDYVTICKYFESESEGK